MKVTINNIEIETDYYVNKWTDWALEATPATDEEVIANVQTLYSKSGLNKPEVRVFRNYEEFLSVDFASVRNSVMDSVWASVRDSVWNSVGASVWNSVWALCWADDLSFGNVFSDTKVLSDEKTLELKEYKKLLETQRIAILTEDIAYVLVAPIIRRNERGQLHSDKELSVDWDGTGIYYLNGVEFKKEWWSKIVNDELTPEEVFAIDNLEHRRIAYDYMDKLKMKSLKDFKVLDEVEDDGRGYSMKIVSFSIPEVDEPLKYLNCFCPSTGREYYLGTDENTCWEAKTKSFGFSSEELEFINEW